MNDAPVSCLGNDPSNLLNCTGTPAAANGNTITTHSLSNAGTGTIGGFIKIERQSPAGAWTDVTMEILNYGIAGRNLIGGGCNDPTPNAILRIERLRDNALAACNYITNQLNAAGAANAGPASLKSTDYWPNALFDPREGLQRDNAPANGNLPLGGVMYYIALDVTNLCRNGSTAPRRMPRGRGPTRLATTASQYISRIAATTATR